MLHFTKLCSQKLLEHSNIVLRSLIRPRPGIYLVNVIIVT